MERGSQGNGINKSQGIEKAKGALDASKDVQQQNGKQAQAFRRVTQFIGFNKTLHLQLLATFLSLNVAESTFSKNDLNGKFVCL